MLGESEWATRRGAEARLPVPWPDCLGDHGQRMQHFAACVEQK